MKNRGGPHQMRPTQPDTRDPEPVDNPRGRYVVGRRGTVHKALCQRLPADHGPRVMDLPAGPRCRHCFPDREVVVGRTMTGWPRNHHPTSETTR